MIDKIKQFVTESTKQSDRGQTVVTSQVFLLILAIGIIGGLAVTLSGVTDDILPGPEGNVELQQDADRLAITIDTLDGSANNVTVTTTGDFSPDSGTQNDGGSTTSEVAFDDPSPGQTVLVTGVAEDDVVNVVAHEEGSDKTNRIATMTVGPTGN